MVLVANAGKFVDAAEKGASHTARGDVVVKRIRYAHQMFAGLGMARTYEIRLGIKGTLVETIG